MKRFLSILLAMAIVITSTACGQLSKEPSGTEKEGHVAFTDSCHREVLIPKNIKKVAVSGPLAQNMIFALAPDKLVGLAVDWDALAEEYIETKYYDLPVLGQLYGGKGEINLEELISAAPDVVIDIGDSKDKVAEDMDALQEQTGIPFVHIDTYLESTDETFESLGQLLGMEKEAKELSDYWNEHYSMIVESMDDVEKVDILYVTGEEGLNVIPAGSYHGEVIDMFTENLAVIENMSSKGSGNEVDMEQLLEWNPGYILFDKSSIYGRVEEMEEWKNMKAIVNGNYYEVPSGPYNWMGFPPSIQRLLGMMWIKALFYPENCQYDLKEEVKECYKMLYHCELTDAQYNKLVANSIGKKE